MRGRLDNINTILGDSFYDYAKIFQSLVGYDEILPKVQELTKSPTACIIDF